MDEINKEFHAFKKEIDTIGKKVDTVLFLLTGNEYDETMGLLNRFIESVTKIQVLEKDIKDRDKENKSRIEKLEKKWEKIIWVGGTAMVTSGYTIWDLFHRIFGSK